jgi:hypothetical protein
MKIFSPKQNCLRKQTSIIAYTPYQLLYGQEPMSPSSMRGKCNLVMDFDDPKDRAKTLEHWATYFQRVVSMALKNLAIFVTILHVKDILHIGVLFLEGKDGQESKENPKNCATCHLPIEGTIWPKLVVVLASYKCNK